MISKAQIEAQVLRAQLKLIEPRATVRLKANGWDVYAPPLRAARSRALLRAVGLEWCGSWCYKSGK